MKFDNRSTEQKQETAIERIEKIIDREEYTDQEKESLGILVKIEYPKH